MSGLEELSRGELIALTRELMAENTALKAEVAELRAENAALRERVAKLERLVSRNSGNSGMPPSVDDLPGRKRPKDRMPGSIAGRRPASSPAPKARRWPGRTRSPMGTSSSTIRTVRAGAGPISDRRPI
ncbi:DUF6444 domain-containing protein [Nonomuraea sp. NPDC026600]|uniref:DUF6444 domain-containing protein n=1 Tax=Nonomuraea sp. NPDC026600 TaxID=3155363 RepID=UPI0033F2F9E0